MRELERVKIIEAVVQHRLTIVLAAERLQCIHRNCYENSTEIV